MSYHHLIYIDSVYGIRGWEIEDKVNWKIVHYWKVKLKVGKLERDEIKKEKLNL